MFIKSFNENKQKILNSITYQFITHELKFKLDQ